MENTEGYSFLDGAEFVLYHQGNFTVNGRIYELNNNIFRITDGTSFVDFLKVLLGDSTITFNRSDLNSLDTKINSLINSRLYIQKLLESMYIHKII